MTAFREGQELYSLIDRFFAVLDRVEESDSGKVFHPTVIRSCRVMDTIELEKVLSRLKDMKNDHSSRLRDKQVS